MLLNPTDRFLLKKGREEGRKEGKKKAQEEIAKNLLDKGFPIEKIVKLTGLSKENILKIV